MSKRIVIVGGGIVGLNIANACLRRGHQVTVLQRDPSTHAGCSFGNAGMIVPSHFVPLAAPGMVALGLKWMWNSKSPFFIQPRLDWDLLAWSYRFWRSSTAAHVARCAPLLRDLHLASRSAYAWLAESGADFGLAQRGLLMLCKTQHGLDEEVAGAEKARALGVPAEELDPAQLAKLDPGATFDVAGAVYYPKDCHLVPERLMAHLAKTARESGADIREGVTVTGWRRENGRLVATQTSAGEIEAEEFVLSAGVWSDKMSRDLDLRIPMQAGKGYSVTNPHPVELPQICSILTEARVAVTPMDGKLRVGGTMEISGIHERVRPRRVQGILEALPKYYPKFTPEQFAGIAPWQGLRPCSPDGMPYLGRTNAATNLIVATGHAMMGVSLAPETGEIAARLVDHEPAGHDIAPLSPDRFA